MPPGRTNLIWQKIFTRRGSVPAKTFAILQKMRIIRGCDAKRNVLVCVVYSDKLIEGSPKN